MFTFIISLDGDFSQKLAHISINFYKIGAINNKMHSYV